MNDWYGNKVSFGGNEENILEVLAFFKEIIYNHSDGLSGYGDFRNFGFLNDGRVVFESDGNSGINALKDVAEHFRVDFLLRFSNRYSYGEAVFTDGQLDVLVLDEAEMRLPAYNQELKAYTYGNLKFATHLQTLQYILDQKRLKLSEDRQINQPQRGFKR
ncbi:hypothetical protein ACRQ5D_34010 [Mucilaginibacter sp. P25]|uniref:hypothetical protein n=1 Tax=Mucilaginibacter sp. P25 TaxID=3423945 RepID=UPI003D798E1E